MKKITGLLFLLSISAFAANKTIVCKSQYPDSALNDWKRITVSYASSAEVLFKFSSGGEAHLKFVSEIEYPHGDLLDLYTGKITGVKDSTIPKTMKAYFSTNMKFLSIPAIADENDINYWVYACE